MAQLELSVVLNLANFRTQLGKLAQASAAYYYPINLTIDKQAFKKQLAALGNIKTTLNINDSQIDAARKRVGTLNKSLATLRRATSTPIEIKLKYVEVGKPPSAAAGQIGQAVSGRIRADEAVAGLNQKQAVAARNMLKAANVPVGELGKGRSLEAYQKSIVEGMTKAGDQAVAGLTAGLKDGKSEVAQAAKLVGEGGLRALKDFWGIASPSRVFKQIGKFAVDGLEIGFLNGLKDFKATALAELKSIVKSLQQEARVGMIAAGGLLSPVARPKTAATRTIPGVLSPRDVVSNQDPGRSNNRILNSLSLLTGDPKLYRSRMANLGANRLPSSLLGSAATQMNLEEIAPSFKEARLGGTKTGVANIIDEAFFGRGTLPKASSALNGLSNTIERLASSARAAVPSGILQSASGNPRFRAFGGVPSSESMGIFPPTAQPTAYPPSGGFLEFSRRATAISAGLPGNVFGGRGGASVPPSGGGGGRRPNGGGAVPPGGFPVDDVMVTRNARLGAVMDVAAASTRNFTASQIPLIGGIKSLAGEFGEATKQVLLYGTAYKGLAFLTSLPGQVLNAAKSQQQFNNGLKVVTQETGTFAKELLYVDNVQRAFGLNLETTRTGFTRLYASMAPTGFDSGSIEKLFTGISAATASLQLTPDKAERVIYAFGQMASKGQIMSEELKGQLGDVLPGALAIFSKAAGMSVKEFSKAMEDGEFVGNRFREVFAKVSDELMNRFGTGAQAAGRSLQGLINTVGGDFQRVLESFSPLANSAAQAILGPLGGSLKQLALSAQIATGEIERVFMQLKESQQELKDLRDSAGTDGIITAEEARQIKAAEQNVGALTLRYKALQKAASDPAIAKQAEDITRFTEELAKAGTFVMNVAQTIGGMLSPVLNFLGGNLTTVIGLITTFYIGFQTARLAAMALMGVLLLYRGISTMLGFSTAAQQATALSGAFSVLGINVSRANIALIGTRAALTALVAATVIGAVVAGIIAIASAFATMKDRAKEAAEESKRAIEEGGRAASMGMTMGVTTQLNQELAKNRAVAKGIETLQKIYDRNKGKMMGTKPIISVEEMARLKAAAEYSNEIDGFISGNQFKDGGFQISAFRAPDLSRAKQQAGQISAEVRKSSTILKAQQKQSQAAEKELGLNKPTPGVTPLETPEEDKTKTSLESYYSLQDQLAKAQTQADLDRLEADFEHKRAMINAEYDLKEAKANSFQKKAIAFQKEIFAITSEQDAALFKNRNKVLAAAGSVAGGAGAAMGGVVAMTGGAVSQDPLTRGRSSGPHLHAQAAGITEKTLRYLVDKYLEVGGKTASAFGQSRGSAGHGYNAIDFLTPQGTPIKLKPGASMSQYGPAGGRGGLMSQVTTPEGSFQLGHLSSLTPGGQAGAGVAPGKVAPSIKRDELANQQVALTAREANASAAEKEAEAIAKLEIATANYVQSLLPTAEQSLQNQLLQQRITLTQNSFSPEILEAQLAFAEQELQVAESIKLNTERINELTAAGSKDVKGIKALTDANNQLKANLPVSAIQLLTKAIDDQVLSLVQRTKTAGRDATDQERVNGLIIGGMTRQSAEAKVTAENLRGDYKKALEEATRQVEIAAAAEEVLAAARRLGKKETAEQTAEYNRLAKALKDAKDKKDALEGRAPEVEGAATGIESSVAPKTASSYIADGLSAAQEKLDQLTNTGYQVVQAANAIGDAFGTAFKGVITGSMTAREALAGMFQSVADHFADMVAQMIAEYLKMALIKGMMAIVGGFAGGAATTSAGSLEGATGDFFLPIPGDILPAANGAVWKGGFQAFANGGVVTGPTLGLVGEGRYNEAVIPLPDGKSVPVQLSGGDGGNQINSNITVNVSNGQAQSNATGSNSSELGRKIEGAVKQVIVGELRPGGLLASR